MTWMKTGRRTTIRRWTATSLWRWISPAHSKWRRLATGSRLSQGIGARRPLIPSRLTPASRMRTARRIIEHRRVFHNRSWRLAKGPPYSVTSPPEPHSALALRRTASATFRHQAQRDKESRDKSSELQEENALGCGAANQEEVKHRDAVALCTERGALRPYDSKTPRVDHEGIQSIAFSAGRVGRVFSSSEEERMN